MSFISSGFAPRISVHVCWPHPPTPTPKSAINHGTAGLPPPQSLGENFCAGLAPKIHIQGQRRHIPGQISRANQLDLMEDGPEISGEETGRKQTILQNEHTFIFADHMVISDLHFLCVVQYMTLGIRPPVPPFHVRRVSHLHRIAAVR